jgi:hypothetical protein
LDKKRTAIIQELANNTSYKIILVTINSDTKQPFQANFHVQSIDFIFVVKIVLDVVNIALLTTLMIISSSQHKMHKQNHHHIVRSFSGYEES